VPKVKGFFKSNTSPAMRVMSFVALVAGVCLAFYGIYKGVDPYALSALCTVFVGGAFGERAWRKHRENQACKIKDSKK
jgi:uncharacterized membrane protein YiaA